MARGVEGLRAMVDTWDARIGRINELTARLRPEMAGSPYDLADFVPPPVWQLLSDIETAVELKLRELEEMALERNEAGRG